MKNIGIISPTREEFLAQSTKHKVIPIKYTVLPDSITPVGLYRRLANNRPGTFLLESAAQGGVWSRYSFIGVSSAATLTELNSQAHWTGTPPTGVPLEGNPVDVLSETLEFLATDVRHDKGEDLPNLISGMVGYFGWDAMRFWLDLPNKPHDDLELPALAMNLVSDLAIHDNLDGTVTLVANAINYNGAETGAEAAYENAVVRIQSMIEKLSSPVNDQVSVAQPGWLDEDISAKIDHSWAEEEFLKVVQKAQEVIDAGEVLQIVPSRRFTAETSVDGFDIYRVLRAINPSPYMFLYTFERPDGTGTFQLVGSSPEALVTVNDNKVVTHPIGGSRPRGETPEEERENEKQLLADPKERSEHEMLVDLATADLSPVCEPGSLHTPRYMFVERYSHILHLVTEIEGTVAKDKDALDVLKAAFPAGTLSGAPKQKCLELIDEWEPLARGPYGGVVGYFDLAGNMDMAIVIRTVILKDHIAYVQAGAGVVAESVPAMEAQETLTKATAPLKAVFAATQLRDVSQEDVTH